MARPRPTLTFATAPVTPGKVAMWLFLATEVMFFTGLIGSYIVLARRQPARRLQQSLPSRDAAQGAGEHPRRLAQVGRRPRRPRSSTFSIPTGGLTEEQAEEVIHEAPHGLVSGLTKEKAEALVAKLKSAGARRRRRALEDVSIGPCPTTSSTNPLAINLTAANTFILICSSVTMVLALSAFQDGKKGKGIGFLAGHRLDRQHRS